MSDAEKTEGMSKSPTVGEKRHAAASPPESAAANVKADGSSDGQQGELPPSQSTQQRDEPPQKKVKRDDEVGADQSADGSADSSKAKASKRAGGEQPNTEVLEKGKMFMLYRPKVDVQEAHSLKDVQKMHVVLAPDSNGQEKHKRLLVMTKKQLPATKGHQRFWSFVEQVGAMQDIERKMEPWHYATKTKGERELQGDRIVAEAEYSIVRHGEHTHLAYVLQTPSEPGEAQKTFNIEKEGSFIVTVKNPHKPNPEDGSAGLKDSAKADYPDELQRKFRNLRFVPLEPAMLDRAGAEVVWIGARHDAMEELGEAAKELERAAAEPMSEDDIREELQMQDEVVHPATPIETGEFPSASSS